MAEREGQIGETDSEEQKKKDHLTMVAMTIVFLIILWLIFFY